MKTAYNTALVAVAAGLGVLSVPLQAASLAQQAPQQLCDQARSLGIMGSPRYRHQSGVLWECSSMRKKLPQGEPASASDLQYRVQGGQEKAQRLILELRMRSYRQPQGVLRAFSDHAGRLFQRLQEPVPEGLHDAITGPVEGTWDTEHFRVRLEKRFSKGAVYDLWLLLETP